jgi:hypothetical protein
VLVVCRWTALVFLLGCQRGKQPLPEPVDVPRAAASSEGRAAADAGADTDAAPRAAALSLRAFDWRNHAYAAAIGLTLRDGRAELREYSEPGLHDTTVWQLVSVRHADLDGDSKEEAIVHISETWHGTRGESRSSARLYVYGLDAAAPRQLGEVNVPAGDAIVEVERGEIVVRWLAARERCQQRYRLAGGAVRENGAGACAPP